MNKKVVVSYPFFFYSMYRFHKTEWAFITEWPQMGAVLLVSTLIAIVLKAGELLLVEHGFMNHMIGETSSLSPALAHSWCFLPVIMANTYYFVWRGNWRRYEKQFDQLPMDVKKRSHFVSQCIVVLALVFFLSAGLSVIPAGAG